MMEKRYKTYTRVENNKFSTVLEFDNGSTVKIPINKDGSVKWFDDSKLIKC